MKQKIFSLFICLGLLLPTVLFAGNDNDDDPPPPSPSEIRLMGKWAGKGPRSVTPLPPSAFLQGDQVTLYLPNTLLGLHITITDSNDIIVYEGVLAGIADSWLPIPHLLEAGEYVLEISHAWGTLTGSFEIE